MKVYWHPEHDVPYAYKSGFWIGWDNLESLRNKVKNEQTSSLLRKAFIFKLFLDEIFEKK
jgi:hypothetical protein